MDSSDKNQPVRTKETIRQGVIDLEQQIRDLESQKRELQQAVWGQPSMDPAEKQEGLARLQEVSRRVEELMCECKQLRRSFEDDSATPPPGQEALNQSAEKPRQRMLELRDQQEKLEREQQELDQRLQKEPPLDSTTKEQILTRREVCRQMVLELICQQKELLREQEKLSQAPEDDSHAAPPTREALDRRVEEARQQMLKLRRQQNELERAREELENLRRGVNEFVEDKSLTVRQLSRMVARIERMRGRPGHDPSAAKQAMEFRPVLQNHLEQLKSLDETVWVSEEIPIQLPQARAKLETAQAALAEVEAILPAQSRWQRFVDFIR